MLFTMVIVDMVTPWLHKQVNTIFPVVEKKFKFFVECCTFFQENIFNNHFKWKRFFFFFQSSYILSRYAFYDYTVYSK